MCLDQSLFELPCKKPWKHTHTDADKDSDEYSIVAFCKNATIIKGFLCQGKFDSKV